MKPPTRRQRKALRLLITHGSPKAAAARLGITDKAVNDRLRRMCQRIGAESVVHAAYLLGRADERNAA